MQQSKEQNKSTSHPLATSNFYLGQRERTASGAVMSLERFGRNDPLAPADFVEVDDQFASLAQGTGRIFGDIQSSVIDALLSITRINKIPIRLRFEWMQSVHSKRQRNTR